MADRSAWPVHLRPGAIRFARTSRHYDETIAFYRDVVGLPVIGEFSGSFGEDGTIFGFPDATVQLEIVRAHDAAAPSGWDQLVLYLSGAAAVEAAVAPLLRAGLTPISDPHPYWSANGAAIFRDPDGRDVVFAPWVYGRDPEPKDASIAAAPLRVGWYDGDRTAVRPLFAEAEDSAVQLDSYIDDGRVLVAWRGAEAIGHLQLVDAGPQMVEIKNMAVAPDSRGTGVGRRLIETARATAAAEGAKRMLVATGAADTGNLRFYQRCGFRFASVERDAFTPDTGYPDAIVIDGVQLRDRVWLDQQLNS
jgi:GNAT superfamily N-acetyltransferase